MLFAKNTKKKKKIFFFFFYFKKRGGCGLSAPTPPLYVSYIGDIPKEQLGHRTPLSPFFQFSLDIFSSLRYVGVVISSLKNPFRESVFEERPFKAKDSPRKHPESKRVNEK